jgi:NCAIR mutase (PurE)-related protein
VRVLCALDGDPAVAAEAAFVARVTGTDVVRVDDLAGRPPAPAVLRGAGAVVVVVGTDPALVGAVRTATAAPVVAVPSSVGSPGGLGELGALMGVLGSGVPVVEVGNGCAAGLFAARVARG